MHPFFLIAQLNRPSSTQVLNQSATQTLNQTSSQNLSTPPTDVPLAKSTAKPTPTANRGRYAIRR